MCKWETSVGFTARSWALEHQSESKHTVLHWVKAHPLFLQHYIGFFVLVFSISVKDHLLKKYILCKEIPKPTPISYIKLTRLIMLHYWFSRLKTRNNSTSLVPSSFDYGGVVNQKQIGTKGGFRGLLPGEEITFGWHGHRKLYHHFSNKLQS